MAQANAKAPRLFWIRTDGVRPTLEAVQSKLAQPIALGYCNVGIVAELGPGVAGFSVGDRVVSNGRHAGTPTW